VSDCGVCVSGNYGSECVGYRRIFCRAGKEWQCSECGCKIPKGKQYELASWFYADHEGHGNAKTCLICAEICEAFMCGGRWHAERFWEDFDDVILNLNTSCFDKLKTPEAKAELQRRWMKSKGLIT
jgi:hypothetical protein